MLTNLLEKLVRRALPPGAFPAEVCFAALLLETDDVQADKQLPPLPFCDNLHDGDTGIFELRHCRICPS